MAHASDAAAGAPLDFSVAVYSSRPYVREFLEAPLKKAFSRVSFLEVGAGPLLPSALNYSLLLVTGGLSAHARAAPHRTAGPPE